MTKFKEHPQCKKCGEDMELTNMPCEIFAIPFTKGRFTVWDMNYKDWRCSYCSVVYEDERRADLEDSIAQSIGREAYEEGFRDGQERR